MMIDRDLQMALALARDLVEGKICLRMVENRAQFWGCTLGKEGWASCRPASTPGTGAGHIGMLTELTEAG